MARLELIVTAPDLLRLEMTNDSGDVLAATDLDLDEARQLRRIVNGAVDHLEAQL